MEVVEQGGQEAMRVEEVQETAAIDQLLLVTGQSEDETANMSNQKTAPVASTSARLPADTPRFLARLELLLSEEELREFQRLFASGNFTEKNPPYQAWLGLKLATLPDAENRAAEQVCTALQCTVLYCTTLH